MGRTNPTYRDMVRAWQNENEDFRRALRRENQERFDRLLSKSQEMSMAAGAMNAIDVERPLFLTMLLTQQCEIDELREEIAVLRE